MACDIWPITWVQVHTDEGIVGLGEVWVNGTASVATYVAEVLAPELLGKDPLDIERHWQRMFYVIFPQAIRRFLPPWINAVTDAVKGSALVSLIGVVDLMLAVQKVIGRTYEPMPLYVTGAIIYFAINYSLSSLSRQLESRYAYIRE